MNRRIRKVAVLGSGVMGSQIACHFANIGCEVLLLDIAPNKLLPQETAKGLSLASSTVKNRIVNSALTQAVKMKPAPLFHKSFASRIKTGNFDDDLHLIDSADWIIEVIIENLEIKQSLFEKVDQHRKAGSIVTSNTSGIPIHLMAAKRSNDFKAHFCGTHFFNPPRYLELLEVIPTDFTQQEVVDFLLQYGQKSLGKTTVAAKDTPAFIANRVGVFSIMKIFQLMEKHDLSIEEVDALTGPISGRPKSATFRTCDVVGIDTLVKVAKNTAAACPNDESKAVFKVPSYVEKMVESGLIGSKTKAGFYKKVTTENGRSIQVIDTNTLDYREKQRPKIPSIDLAKQAPTLAEQLRILCASKDKFGAFFKELTYSVIQYSAFRIPEIADNIFQIDDAMRAGFGWKMGPFEQWEALGLQPTLREMTELSMALPSWVTTWQEKEMPLYNYAGNTNQYYNVASASEQNLPNLGGIIGLNKGTKQIWNNDHTTIHDLGDGVLCLEFHSKMNTIGGEVLTGIHKAIDWAEKEYEALVIGNQGDNFSVGANLGLIFMLAIEQEYDELDFAIRAFQKAMMRVRYSSIPVVVAPHHMTLGGGCELTLHADAVQAAAETYIGLVEFGVGLIPGGAGTKEMTLRAADEYKEGQIPFTALQANFLSIAQAKVATSAYEAIDLNILSSERDGVSMHFPSQIADAKRKALQLVENGYIQPIERTDIKVLGREALASMYTGAHSFLNAGYISEHDKKIAQKLAYVMSGGDLSAPQEVSEQYLLNIERQAFLSLLGEKKTLERIQHMLKTGKPLRN